MAQIRYTQDQVQAFAGMKADLATDYVTSRSAEGEVNFGFGVEGGTAGDQCKTFAGGTFLGLALHTHKEDGKYLDEETVNVLRTGTAYVVLEAGQTPAIGGAVYCNDTTGDFRTDATGGTLVAGATFQSVSIDSSSLTEALTTSRNIALVEFK